MTNSIKINNEITFSQQVTFLAGLTVIALVSTWSVFFLA